MFSKINEWFALLFTAAVVAAACDIFAASTLGKSESIKKCLKLILGLCVSCAVILPIFSALSGINGIKIPDGYHVDAKESGVKLNAVDDYTISLTQSNLENQLKKKLEEKLGINIPELRIELYKKENEGSVEVVVSKVTVYIKREDESAEPELTNQVKELLSCDAVIKFEDER
jgi:Stage III sporulation protein AF (Spore_III_AF).